MGANILIYPILRKDRINKAGEAQVLIRFDIDRKPVGYDNIKKRIPVPAWDDEKRRVKDSPANSSPFFLFSIPGSEILSV